MRSDLPDPKAHYEFAVALAHLKRTREAMSQYASALLIQPDFPDALDGLAWILSTDANPDFRNGTEAVKMAERACELTGRNDPVKLKTLAAAYAETGRFEEAMNTLRTAKDLAAKARSPATRHRMLAHAGTFPKVRAVARCTVSGGRKTAGTFWKIKACRLVCRA